MSRHVEYEYSCEAPKAIFTPKWEDVPEVYKRIIEDQGKLGCEGGGVPGRWCEYPECYWFGGVITKEWEE